MSQMLKRLLVQGGYMDPASDGTGGGSGGEGNDTQPGGDGKDTQTGGEGNDSVEGGEGKDKDKKKSDQKKPSDGEAKLLKEVMEKKGTIAELQAKLKAFEGIDPTQVKKLLEKQAADEKAAREAEEKRLAEQGQWETLKKQMNEANEAERKKLQDQIDALNSQLGQERNEKANLTVGNAFGNSKFIAEEMALTPSKARIVYGSHFEFKDGKIVGFDKPAGATGRTMLIDGKGEPLPFEDAIRKIVDTDPDKDQLLKSKLKQGASSSTLPGNKKVENAAELSGKEKIAAGLRAAGSKK